MKNSEKAMSKRRSKFPNASDAKIKRGNVVGPKLRKGTLDENFKVKLNSTELAM
jgi:hypothetical protein